MSFRGMVDQVLDLADAVNEYLPGSGLSQGAIDLARKAGDIVEGLGEDIPQDQQERAQQLRAQLAEKVKAKAKSTSDRLRGD